MVHDGDIALASGHGADLVGIPALRRAGHVADNTGGEAFSGFCAVFCDHAGYQRLVIDIGGGAHAHAAFKGGRGDIVITLYLGRIDPVAGVDDNACRGWKNRTTGPAGAPECRARAPARHQAR